MRDAVNNNQQELPTVADFPELGRRLTLICESCRRMEDYRVGRVLIDPFKYRSYTDRKGPFEDAVSFSGIFHCQHCGAGGPWEIPPQTRRGLLAVLALPSDEPGEYGVQFGRLQLFDGTVTRTGVEAEAYLKQKLEEQPENGYLWNRLANLYEHAGFWKHAREAYEKAIHLDPSDVESQYSLGTYLMQDGEWKAAEECFEAALRQARTQPHQNLHLIVRACLECLFELHNETGGEIRFPPTYEPTNAAEPTSPEDIGLMELDLSSDEGWEVLTSLYLTGKVPERTQQRAARESPLRLEDSDEDLPASELSRPESGGGTIRGTQRVGRNDPCPCGSGKKYKRCCLRR